MRRSNALAVIALGALLAIAALGSARAEQFQFAGRSLEIEPPQGYCALDRSHPDEAQMLDLQERLQKRQNRVAMMFLECQDLAQRRAGNADDPQRYGMVLIPQPQGEVRAIPDMTRAEFVAAVAKPLPQLDADALSRDIGDQVGQAVPGATVNNVKLLGVLKQDARAVYVGVSVGGMSQDGKTVSDGAVGITAITLVNQIPVSLNLYRVKGGAEAIPGLLADQQRNVDALIAANAASEPPSPPIAPSPPSPSSMPSVPSTAEAAGSSWHGFNMDWAGSGAIQGIVIVGSGLLAAIAVGFVLARRRRR